jgi:ArsR family transcriptional regulator
VLDIGAGDGAIAALLASRAESYTCLDKSERMIEAARRRLASYRNVHFEVADMLELPFGDASFDQVLLFNTLQYAESPERAIGEAARVVAPGGKIALVTLATHEHADVTGAYGHVQIGFSPRLLRRLLEHAGLVVEECAVTSREKRKPYFEVVTAFGKKRHANAKKARPNGAGLRHNARTPGNGADPRGKRR